MPSLLIVFTKTCVHHSNPSIYSGEVPHPKKRHDNKGEPTHHTKDKHRIKKMPNDVTADALVEIRHKHDIPSYVGMMSIHHHLYYVDDPPISWLVIHLAPFKIGLWCLFPRMVARILSTFNINLTQFNPNRCQYFLCSLVITSEHKVDLTSEKIRCICFLKRNDLDKGRAYVSCVAGQGLPLKLPDSTTR